MAEASPPGAGDPPPPRTALVTGASTGIGRAFARRLAAEGFHVIAVARREDRLRALTEELGPGHEYLVADLATAVGRERTAEVFASRRVHLLVNNAGAAAEGGFTDVPLARALEAMHLNCDALVALAHAFLAAARPGDALLNMSSTLAFAPAPGLGVYSATKAFVTSLSESLWAEQRAAGVYVLGLCPGMTATESQPHRDVPGWLVQTPERVVDAALAALHRRRRPTVVTGRSARILAAAARLLPRRTALAALGHG
ncbi:SDR family NAD(P)-dependent oxidoreductase [Kitasatospora sp. NPDC052868]|uniref:SDR family NAD(P)-dependent oxidoreductase n=1 Tax=Kitasatospora sp. NPDC052868 TaxID=3364060 RepID=UPI0037C93851